MTVEDILLWIGGVELPKGDPAKCREAARIWRQLAKDIDDSIKSADPVAADVWGKNSGDGIDAFKAFWTNEFAPYPEELVAYCNRVAGVCEAYAKTIEDVTYALILLAIQTYAAILITFAWGWITGYSELLAIRFRAFFQARITNALALRLIQLLIESLLDSLMYAGATQLLQLGIFGIANAVKPIDGTAKQTIGYDPFSVGTNANQFFNTFGSNMVFDLALGPNKAAASKIPILGKSDRFVGFAGRMGSSELFSVTSNLMNGNDPLQGFSWHQQVDKLIFHGGRMLKNPAKGPVGYRGSWPPPSWAGASP